MSTAKFKSTRMAGAMRDFRLLLRRPFQSAFAASGLTVALLLGGVILVLDRSGGKKQSLPAMPSRRLAENSP
jgi:hypothetical protein